MEEVSLEKCVWCNGSGKEVDNHHPCFDCEGTGYKEGNSALNYFNYLMEQQESKEKGLV